MNYYMVVDGRRQGPFAETELAARGLERDTLVWCVGQSDWEPADQVPGLRDVLATIPPPVPLEARLERPGYHPEAHRYTPASFQSLHRGWLITFAAFLVMPLLGGLCFLLAQTQYVPYNTGRYTYYRYNDLGQALIILGACSLSLTVVPIGAAVTLFAMLLYRMWAVLQDGHARTTPDKAVGFLFIPFFNLYWVFVAVYGLAVDLNAYVRRHRVGMDAEPAPTGLALTFGVLFCCAAVPYLNVIVFVPLAVVSLLLLTRLKNAVLAILRVRQAVAQSADEPTPTTAIVERPHEPALGRL